MFQYVRWYCHKAYTVLVSRAPKIESQRGEENEVESLVFGWKTTEQAQQKGWGVCKRQWGCDSNGMNPRHSMRIRGYLHPSSDLPPRYGCPPPHIVPHHESVGHDEDGLWGRHGAVELAEERDEEARDLRGEGGGGRGALSPDTTERTDQRSVDLAIAKGQRPPPSATNGPFARPATAGGGGSGQGSF